MALFAPLLSCGQTVYWSFLYWSFLDLDLWTSLVLVLLPNGLLLTFLIILVRISLLTPALILGASWDQECPYFVAPLDPDRIDLSVLLCRCPVGNIILLHEAVLLCCGQEKSFRSLPKAEPHYDFNIISPLLKLCNISGDEIICNLLEHYHREFKTRTTFVIL